MLASYRNLWNHYCLIAISTGKAAALVMSVVNQLYCKQKHHTSFLPHSLIKKNKLSASMTTWKEWWAFVCVCLCCENVNTSRMGNIGCFWIQENHVLSWCCVEPFLVMLRCWVRFCMNMRIIYKFICYYVSSEEASTMNAFAVLLLHIVFLYVASIWIVPMRDRKSKKEKKNEWNLFRPTSLHKILVECWHNLIA